MEEKLKLENEIAKLKKELKVLTAQVEGGKKECASIFEIKENNEKTIEEQRGLITILSNQISQERLDWETKKSKEEDILKEKLLEVEKILESKKELDIQERKIQSIHDNNVNTLNETRRLELIINEKENSISLQNKKLAADLEHLNARELDINNKKEFFKAKINEILEQIKEI